jgi:serine/threonine protein kinase
VKLLDFGLAQLFVGESPAARQPRGLAETGSFATGSELTTVAGIGAFAGTPGYMSPESRTGQSLDGAADLWSLGVVLFECLTGERAFTERSVEADWARELEARAPGCPPHLSALVADLLAPDKRKRPKSARAVLARLRDAAALDVA